MKLDKLQYQREGSEWLSDPVRIAERQGAADFMANYADTSVLDGGRIYSDAEEEEEDEAPPREEEEGSSDSAAADDGSDDVGEEAEVTAPEATATGAPRAAADVAGNTVVTEAANASAEAVHAPAEAASDAATTSASASLAVDPQTSNPAT